MSKSLALAQPFLGQIVKLVIDRPKGSSHPEHGFLYEENYGYVPNTVAPDGEELDAYFLGEPEAFREVKSICIAIIHRLDDDDDKLIVVPEGQEMKDEEIERRTSFQEQFFKSVIVR